MNNIFEHVFNEKKKNIKESLEFFGADNKVNKAILDLEVRRGDFYDFYESGQQSKQAEVDELRKRIEEKDKLINNFINDLDETSKSNDSKSIHDYWRGFGSCAESAKQTLIQRLNDLKGNTNED